MKPDAELEALLKRWRGIEPPADFNARVWARVRQAERPLFFPRPQLLAVAASLFLSLGIGIGMGLVRREPPSDAARMSTIAGDYVRLVQGGSR